MTTYEDKIEEFAKILSKNKSTVFLGGAGVSTESGIPDFRGENGLYKKRDKQFLVPKMEMLLSNLYFKISPRKFFQFYRKTAKNAENVKPNRAHKALAMLEDNGLLEAIITQNIDGLHQEAGSETVYEIHGTKEYTYCNKCKKHYSGDYILTSKAAVPKCRQCGGIIRPAFVLFGEQLPSGPWMSAIDAVSEADTLIVGGTSLNVAPAKDLIRECFKGKNLIIINNQETEYDSQATLIFRENIGDVLTDVVNELV